MDSLLLLVIGEDRTYGVKRGLEMDPESELDEAERTIEGAEDISPAPRSRAPVMELMLSPRLRFCLMRELWMTHERSAEHYTRFQQALGGDSRVEEVLDGIVGAPWEVLGHLCPPRANLGVHAVDELLLLCCPFTLIDCRRGSINTSASQARARRGLTGRVQVVVPSLPALLATARTHVGGNHHL